MGAAVQAWEQNPTTQASGGKQEDLVRILEGIMNNRYDTDKLVFDKGRGWAAPQIIKTLSMFTDVKIVSTVRPIAECLASFAKVAKADDMEAFCKGHLAQHLFSSYHALKTGYEEYSDKFLLIEYDQLVSDTQTQMDRISTFVGMSIFTHDLADVPDSGEKDKIWDIKNLHHVRKKVHKRKYSTKKILGEELYTYYQGGEFWNDKPAPVRDVDLLDLQLEASLRGNFKKAAQITEKLLVQRPNCNRVKFNAGWHKLHTGNLQAGHKLLEYGRLEDVFGNKDIKSKQPIWNGEKGTVLLNMEGGLGDQIKSYRFAFDLQERGNRVVISCSSELASMFAEKFAVVQHEAACGVYHDYWLPSMSAIVPLELEYEDLKGTPYIERTADPIAGRVGVRWSGNPKFEHEQYRVFPSELIFNAVNGMECVSLQRDDGAELRPMWMPQANVDDWQTTRKSISECELVISSCTSVAHLAAAMGVETWIVVPILSYYVWALPGDVSPYYNSVTLFRQEKYGSWKKPFIQIKEKLQCMHTLKKMAA